LVLVAVRVVTEGTVAKDFEEELDELIEDHLGKGADRREVLAMLRLKAMTLKTEDEVDETDAVLDHIEDDDDS